jgi:hypothetical protein
MERKGRYWNLKWKVTQSTAADHVLPGLLPLTIGVVFHIHFS